MRFFLILCLQFSLFALDFDCIFVGSSPIPMIEALYQSHTGKKVLIVEEDSLVGGAWKSIDVCGIAHADMGCHQMGSNGEIKRFLEEVIGCKMVPLSNPLGTLETANSPVLGEFYPSGGCHELISQILFLLSKTDTTLLLNHKAERIYFDVDRQLVEVTIHGKKVTTGKVFLAPFCSVQVENLPIVAPTPKTARAYHLYVLVEDPTPFRFTYQHGFSGISRIVNLTPFVGLQNTPYQLIVFQTHGEQSDAQKCIGHLISSNFLHPNAKILKSETFTYMQGHFNTHQLNQLTGIKNLYEIVNTSHIQNMSNQIPRWRTVLRPQFP